MDRYRLLHWFRAHEIYNRDLAPYLGLNVSRISKWATGAEQIPDHHYTALLRLYLHMQHLRNQGQDQREALRNQPTLLTEGLARHQQGRLILDEWLTHLFMKSIDRDDPALRSRVNFVAACRSLALYALLDPESLVLDPAHLVQLSGVVDTLQDNLRRIMEQRSQEYHEDYFGQEETTHGTGQDVEAPDGPALCQPSGQRQHESDDGSRSGRDSRPARARKKAAQRALGQTAV
jgi:hypothetical protein